MSFRLLCLICVLLTTGLLSNCAGGQSPPPVNREFRAAWIATVANIDWPSRPGLAPEVQRSELVALFDLAARLRMNAVVLQVRPACDAMYRSELEPWSEYLTGIAGKRPDDNYDPLEFAVAEAHARGLELHAWFNPYRASHPTQKSPPSAAHISNLQPDIVKRYGAYQWLDPAAPAAIEHSTKVILDVVRRYDIDAVHFDDYFYPYPITDDDGNEVPFPDDASWQRYQARGPASDRLSRDDFRRARVNQFLEGLSRKIKQEKPWVRFGISPFGIYRPGQPESIKGFDAYAKLYADSKRWLEQGTVDYLSPQLYWPIEQRAQSFPVLLEWWRAQNPLERHLWPGLFTSKIEADGGGWPPSEIEQQIAIVRQQVAAPGHIHFSIKAIQQNRSGIADLLEIEVYQQPAIPPATNWCKLPDLSTDAWQANVESDADGATVRFGGGDAPPWLWVVQLHHDGQWATHVVPGAQESLELSHPVPSTSDLVITPVDRLNRLHDAIEISEIAGR